MLTPWKESYDQFRYHIKKQRHYFANKGLSSQGYGFSSGHVWMWELDCEENWAMNNWCFWTVVLEKTLESPLNCKEIQPVHPKWDQPWVFIGRTDAEAETPILWSPDAKSWLIGKDPDAGRDWGQEEKGWQRKGCLDGITDSMDVSMSMSKLWELVMDEAWRAAIHGVTKSRTRLSNWTELNWIGILKQAHEFESHFSEGKLRFREITWYKMWVLQRAFLIPSLKTRQIHLFPHCRFLALNRNGPATRTLTWHMPGRQIMFLTSLVADPCPHYK